MTTDDSHVVAGDGPGGGYVQRVGITFLAAYLLAFTLGIVWELHALWPTCDPSTQASPVAGSTNSTSNDTSHAKSNAPTGGSTGETPSFKVDSIDPDSGSTNGGESVTLNGSGLEGAQVFFGSAQAAVTSTSSSKVTAITPAHPKQEKVDVKVTNVDGKSVSRAMSYTYGPPASVKVTSVAPNSGEAAGGTSVQINGEGFLDKPTVKFGSSPASGVQWKSANWIFANTPAHSEGTVDVTVTNTDGTHSMLPAGYTYEACLSQCRSRLLLLVLLAGALGGCFHALRSLWMFVGNRNLKWSWALMYFVLPVNGAMLAFIFFIMACAGTGFFSQPQGSNSCFWIIGIAALVGLFSQQASEKLKTVAEAVFSPVSQKADSLSGGLSIASINPSTGPAKTRVNITGRGFTKNSTATFGGIAGINLQFDSPTSIWVDAPEAKNPGPVDVGVTDPGSNAKGVKPNGFTYT